MIPERGDGRHPHWAPAAASACGCPLPAGARGEGHAADDLVIARGDDGGELLARGERGRTELVGDRDELIRVRALVAAAADRRGDRPDRDGPVLADLTGDVPQAVGGRRPRQAGYR